MPPETTWQIIRDWMTAIGTVGATAIAVYVAVIRDRWRRPDLELKFDPDPGAQDLVVVDVGQLDPPATAYFRLRVIAKAKRAAADGVEVMVTGARAVEAPHQVLNPGTPIRIEGQLLAWSNTNEKRISRFHRVPSGTLI